MRKLIGLCIGVLLGLCFAPAAQAVELRSLEISGHRVLLEADTREYTVSLTQEEIASGMTISATADGRVWGTGTYNVAPSTLKLISYDERGHVDEYTLHIHTHSRTRLQPGTLAKVTDGTAVALTVDDGYNAEAITRILNVTKACGVQASFFVTGACLKKHPELWQRALEEGHEICWHSMYHDRVDEMSTQALAADLDAWLIRAREVLGAEYEMPSVVRLPYGAGKTNDKVNRVFKERGLLSMVWSVDPLSASGKNITVGSYTEILLSQTRENSIILLHFNITDSLALEKALPVLCRKYPFRKLSEIYSPVSDDTPVSDALIAP